MRISNRFAWLTVIVLLLVAAFLLVVEFPWPWMRARPEAIDRSNYLALSVLGNVVKNAVQAKGRADVTWADLAAAAQHLGIDPEQFARLRREIPYKENTSSAGDLELVHPAKSIGKVVLRGQQRDRQGMVWAITEKGYVVKIESDFLH